PYGGAEHIRLTDPDGGDVRALGVGWTAAVGPRWTPDGSRIAFDSPRQLFDGGLSATYIIDADGQNLALLSEGPGSDRAPVWSPDGSRVAIVPRDLEPRIVVQDADGANRRYVTNAATGGDGSPSWSPDGRSITFVVSDRSYVNLHRRALSLSSGADIRVVNLDDMSVRKLTSSRDFDGMPSWSP
ncbi:hypothetical protein HOI71_05370, partial [Candidatus Poribacteria bacterium]|nr:hypothetical protein [Candidatus Poribacteria bacterium]